MSDTTARRRFLWALQAVQVRLRFVLVLVAAGFVIGGWDTLRTYWDRWVMPAGRDPSLGAVSGDTEYFCPMDPGVLSSWSAKCPVCNMTLVRRLKTDMTPLPNGIVARVHLTPDRVQLAGIRTTPIGFVALQQSLVIGGMVARRNDGLGVVASAEGFDRLALTSGAVIEVTPDPPDGRGPFAAKLEGLESDGGNLVARFRDTDLKFRPGDRVKLEIRTPIADREPFRSLPDDVPPLQPREARVLFVCGEHPDVITTASGSCPKDGNVLMSRSLAADQRIRWWCPMHPKTTSEIAGAQCDECDGMTLRPRVLTYRPRGKVLAVPETAVIDTGAKRVVYVESMSGTFDAVEVLLGPRCGTSYPVVSGLEAGQNVASSGAFLIDAETRLNPALAAGYFGASRPAIEGPAQAPTKLDFSGLSATDRDLAMGQKTCPVTKKSLGSMGPPIKVTVGGRSVFVCCDGCIETLTATPSKYLTPDKSAHHP